MKWGLIARNGTKAKPLEEGAAKHFKDTQFNCIADGAGGMKGEDKDAIRAAQPMAPAFKKVRVVRVVRGAPRRRRVFGSKLNAVITNPLVAAA